jgi:chromosome segregation ATPase
MENGRLNGNIPSSDSSSRILVLESRVDTLNTSVEKLEEKIDQNYATLHSRISDLRDDIHSSIEHKHEKIIEKLDQQAKSSAEQHKAISDASTVQYKALAEKVQHLEKWRWMLMGGAAVLGYILAHIRFEKLF